MQIASSWGSAPDPSGGAYDDPPDPLVGWEEDTPPQTPFHSHHSAFASGPAASRSFCRTNFMTVVPHLHGAV